MIFKLKNMFIKLKKCVFKTQNMCFLNSKNMFRQLFYTYIF